MESWPPGLGWPERDSGTGLAIKIPDRTRNATRDRTRPGAPRRDAKTPMGRCGSPCVHRTRDGGMCRATNKIAAETMMPGGAKYAPGQKNYENAEEME